MPSLICRNETVDVDGPPWAKECGRSPTAAPWAFGGVGRCYCDYYNYNCCVAINRNVTPCRPHARPGAQKEGDSAGLPTLQLVEWFKPAGEPQWMSREQF